MLTIALPKGRVSDETLALFSKILHKDILFNDRKLIVEIEDFTFLLVRNQDVPTYVYYGVADLGVAGLDVLEERIDADVVRLLNLNIGKCKVVLGSECGKPIDYLKPRIKIATKMVNITQNFFRDLDIPAWQYYNCIIKRGAFFCVQRDVVPRISMSCAAMRD